MHSQDESFWDDSILPLLEGEDEDAQDTWKLLPLKLDFPCGKQLEGKEMSPDPPWKQCLYLFWNVMGSCQFYLQAGSTHLLATWLLKYPVVGQITRNTFVMASKEEAELHASNPY